MVALTGAMTAEAVLAGTLRNPIGDLFADRITATLPWSEPVDVSTAGTEAGETTDSMTKTVWREVPVADVSRLLAQATGTSPRVGVWRQTSASLLAEEAPALSNLERVGGTGQSSLTIDVDQSWLVYYVQAGVTAGTGADLVLTIGDATPPYGGTFGTAVDVWGVSGSTAVDTGYAVQEAGEPDPTGMSPTATAWLRWTCPDPAPEKTRFEMPSVSDAGQVGLAVYTGTTLAGLVKVTDGVAAASDGVAVEFVPDPGAAYYVQVATTDDQHEYEILWGIPAEAAAPVPPAQPYDYLRVEVYDKDGTTFLTEVPRRVKVNGLEPHNVPGQGSLSVPLHDPLLKAYKRLLRSGRFVKFFLGETCISGFRIQNRTSVWVSSGEYAGMTQTVSGPTVHFLLNDAIVHHDEDPRPDSPATRFYSWASRPGQGEDRWFHAEDWDNPVNAWSQDDPPGDWKKPPKKRSRYGYPKKWPDPDSQWLWMKSDPAMNDGGYDPGKPLAGRRYYRHALQIAQNGTAVRMFVTADENVQVYLDGDEVIRRKARERGYKTFTKYETVLAKGTHTIAIHVRAAGGGVKSGVGDGVDAMMFTLYRLDDDGKKAEVLLRSNGTWNAWYGRNVPGWNRAQVLKSSLQEARDRGNDAANLLQFGFDGLTDSDGKAWTDRFNQEAQIGTSGLDLQSQLSESGKFDVWVDPTDFTIRAWRRRGTDKSASVALIPGVNLLDYAAEEQDEIGNDFLIQYDGGFTTVRATASIKAHGARETYVELGGVKDEDTAKDVIRDAIAAYRDFRNRSGSPEVILKNRPRPDGSLIGIEGAYPFLDFTVGDVISAPDEEGRMVPQRVMALAFTEDENGNLTFDPDLEQVAAPEPIGESI